MKSLQPVLAVATLLCAVACGDASGPAAMAVPNPEVHDRTLSAHKPTSKTVTGKLRVYTWLTNVTDTSIPWMTYPWDHEIGHLVAARLTPSKGPFTVTRLRYHLRGVNCASWCDSTLAHRVELSVSKKKSPPASPGKVFKYRRAMGVLPISRMVERVLPQPFTVPKGRHLFVALAMTGEAEGQKMCITLGDKNNGTPSRSYWSNATQAPYPWTTLASFNIDADAYIEAYGYYTLSESPQQM